MVILWRVLHVLMSRYGSVPIGQLLVEYTTVLMNELRCPPTVTELCEATGLPKSSISRYISAQMDRGVVAEEIDPDDRRRRRLVPTEDGRTERRWQIRQLRRILAEAKTRDDQLRAGGLKLDAATQLDQMRKITRNAPAPYGRRKQRQRSAA